VGTCNFFWFFHAEAGTELYQECLARAVAQHYKANILIFDASRLSSFESGVNVNLHPERHMLARQFVTATGDSLEDETDLWPESSRSDNFRRTFKKGICPLRFVFFK
jgi:hypothetical protein